MDRHNYRRYLLRLYHLTYVELPQKVAALDYFSNHATLIDTDLGDVEPLLPVFISGLRYDVTFSLFRLLDKKNSDRNIHHFINVTEQAHRTLRWRNPFDIQKVKEHRAMLEEIAYPIGNLIKRRNKFFAHYDKEYFFDEEALDNDVPFYIEDAKRLMDVLIEIVLFYRTAFDGIHSVREWQLVVYSCAERLYQCIRGTSVAPCELCRNNA